MNAYTTNSAAVAEMAATLEISAADALAFINRQNASATVNAVRAKAIGKQIGVRVAAYPSRAVFGDNGMIPSGPSATLVYASGRLFGDPALVAAIRAAM